MATPMATLRKLRKTNNLHHSSNINSEAKLGCGNAHGNITQISFSMRQMYAWGSGERRLFAQHATTVFFRHFVGDARSE
jgi:hypothetical protein